MNTHRATAALRRTAAALALAALAGCATGPNVNPRDPFELFNRDMTELNDRVDSVVLKPTATAYREFVPAMVRTGVSNFFGNLSDAWSMVNSALQFKFVNAADNMMRFVVNTTVGLGGVLDPASDMNIERHREDFGQTLGFWGVPAGPYIVLPLLGPSTLRDTVALPVDWRGDLVTHVKSEGDSWSLIGLRVVNVRSNLLRASDVLEGAALDKYSFTRDAYLQRRRSEIGSRRGEINDGTDGREDDGSDGGDGSKGSDGSDGGNAAGEAPAASAPAQGATPAR